MWRLKLGLWAFAAAVVAVAGTMDASAGPSAIEPAPGPAAVTEVPSSAPAPVDANAYLPPDPTASTSLGPASTAAAPRPVGPVLAAPAVLADDVDLPDPFVLRADNRWWVYATGASGRNLQVTSSTDLHSWGATSDPLPVLPAWAAPGFTWAPAVMVSRGRFLLFYTARDARLGRQCISVALAGGPSGPFIDNSASPLICQTSDGGSIDPDPFVGPDGTGYRLWKSDDNGIGAPTRIGGQRLSDDGLSLVGPRPRLLSADSPWEEGVIEGPAMVAASDRYYLFYGGGRWDTTSAGIGYAVCDSPLGPCHKASVVAPWLASRGPAVGPSGPAPFVDLMGGLHLAFHAWTAGPEGQPIRALWLAAMRFG